MPTFTIDSAQIAIAVALWLGALIAAVASIKTDLKNIKESLTSAADNAEAAHLAAAKLQGTVEALPCRTCKFGG
jgi:hypothetical protein